MRNQKGLTLVEVLGSITLLGIAVLGILYILQQGTIHSRDNTTIDQAVQITRTVMEEVKQNLKVGPASILVYGQSLQLSSLRTGANVTLPDLYYPTSSDRRYKITIQTLGHTLPTVNVQEGIDVNLRDQFRLVRVTCEHIVSGKNYQLEAYIEF